MKINNRLQLFLLAVVTVAVLIGALFSKEERQVYASIEDAIEQSVRADEMIYDRFLREDGEMIIFYDPSMDAYSLIDLVETKGGYYFRDATAWFKPNSSEGFGVYLENSGVEVKAESMNDGKMQFTLIEK